MNTGAFTVIAVLTLLGALAAATLPRLIHAALSLVAAFVGLAAFFIFLGAEFIGLAQIFVYVGAVAVLIVFTILLTRRESTERDPFNWTGAIVAVAVFGGLLWAISRSGSLWQAHVPNQDLTVRNIGDALMTTYIWPLLCVGLVLTAALIGALMLVFEEKR
jgi:NADH:ubiquinone oxidoreductase subunit 6 (subunit J)